MFSFIRVLFLSSILAAVPAFADSDVIFEQSSGKAYVLKHKNGAVAFVRDYDRPTLERLINQEGYELVARRTEGGIAPVVASVVSSESADDVIDVVSVAKPKREAYSDIDFGAGIDVGLTTGGKGRLMVSINRGPVVGVDLDLGTIIFISEATASLVAGWSFEPGDDVIRPYVTVGAGQGVVFALLAAGRGPVVKAGAGVEWKPTQWFGVGIEAGYAVLTPEQTSGIGSDGQWEDGEHDPIAYPFGRLTFMFYL